MGFDPFTNTSLLVWNGSERGRIRGLEGLEGSETLGVRIRGRIRRSLSLYILSRARGSEMDKFSEQHIR